MVAIKLNVKPRGGHKTVSYLQHAEKTLKNPAGRVACMRIHSQIPLCPDLRVYGKDSARRGFVDDFQKIALKSVKNIQ